MIKKRCFAVLLSAFLLIFAFASCNSTSDSDSDGFKTDALVSQAIEYNADEIPIAPVSDFTYVVSDSKVFITKYNGDEKEVAVPSQIDDLPVASLLSSAFFGNEDLCALVIPEGVTSIKDNAFYGCTSLVFVSLPSTLDTLGENVFANCTSLQTLSLPSRISEIPKRTFYGCTSLKEVTMGSHIANIGDYAFADCSSIVGFSLSDTVVSIGEFAFFNCENLSVVQICGQTTFAKTTFLQSPQLTLYVDKGSIAHELAVSYHIAYMVSESVS